MMKKCIIFDVDGTLWNSSDGVIEAGNEIIEKELGIKNHLTQKTIDRVMGLEVKEIAGIYFPWMDYEKGMELVLKCMDNENAYLSKHGGVLYEHVEDVLKQLSQKHDLMIVTNAQKGYVDAMFTAHSIGQYFKDYIEAGETGLPKGKNIQLMMERHGYKEAVYVGDTMKDYDACQEAHVPMIYCSYGFGQVDHFWKKIDSFSELLNIFE